MKRPLLIAAGVLVLLLAAGGGYALLSDEDPPRKRGSAGVEFNPREPKAPRLSVLAEPWPTFGYDVGRTKVSPYAHRPPYKTLWRIDGKDTFEYPPSAAYGNVYIAQQKGLFFARNGRTGKAAFPVKDFGRCAASAPTLANETIYQAYMDKVGDLDNPCPQDASDPTGFVIAMDARTGRRKWRFKAQPVESSPLLRDGILYFGSWDGNVYAVRASTGKKVWSYNTGDRVNTSPAFAGGRVFVANDSGTLYALNARTGKLGWSASDATEFFYASPATAYGRVFIGSTDGTMYAYGATTGNLLWARPLGTYIYSSAALFERTVYVGTYDGRFYALDAATGDSRWEKEMPSAVHAPPTVMDGLVYVATCATCGSEAQREVKMGVDSTAALNARNGRQVWRNNAGKYAMPIIADTERVYLTGRSFLYGLRPRGAQARSGDAARGATGKKQRRDRKRSR